LTVAKTAFKRQKGQKLYISVTEYAKRKKCSRQNIWNYLVAGRIPGAKYYKEWSRWRVPEDAEIIEVKQGRPKKK